MPAYRHIKRIPRFRPRKLSGRATIHECDVSTFSPARMNANSMKLSALHHSPRCRSVATTNIAHRSHTHQQSGSGSQIQTSQPPPNASNRMYHPQLLGSVASRFQSTKPVAPTMNMEICAMLRARNPVINSQPSVILLRLAPGHWLCGRSMFPPHRRGRAKLARSINHAYSLFDFLAEGTTITRQQAPSPLSIHRFTFNPVTMPRELHSVNLACRQNRIPKSTVATIAKTNGGSGRDEYGKQSAVSSTYTETNTVSLRPIEIAEGSQLNDWRILSTTNRELGGKLVATTAYFIPRRIGRPTHMQMTKS